MRRVEICRIAGVGMWALFAAGAHAQVLRPAGAPPLLAPWQGGTTVSSLVTLHPDVVDGWDVRAIVEPVSKPTAVRLAARRGKNIEDATLLSFEVRAVAGLEKGRIYRVLIPLDARARRSDAKRLLLLGYRPDAQGRLRVVSQSRLDRLMSDTGTTVEAGTGTLFADALVPTGARRPAVGSEPLAASYRSVLDALSGAPAPVVRDVTRALAELPDADSPVGPRIEGGSAVGWIRNTLGGGLAALPRPAPLERFRYDGLLAAWDRPRLALGFLKSLPSLLAEIGLDPRLATSPALQPEGARTDQEFLGTLDLFSGVDADALFEALWNTPLRRLTIDPRMSTRAPSVENQRRGAYFFDDDDPGVRSRAYSSLAGWNTDWERLKVSNNHWSEAANGVVIDDEPALRAYWEAKLGVVRPREP